MGILYQIALYLASIIFILTGGIDWEFSHMPRAIPNKGAFPYIPLDNARCLWENKKGRGGCTPTALSEPRKSLEKDKSHDTAFAFGLVVYFTTNPTNCKLKDVMAWERIVARLIPRHHVFQFGSYLPGHVRVRKESSCSSGSTVKRYPLLR